MNVIKLIENYYEPGSKAHHFLLHHSTLVADKALRIAARVADLKPDLDFIKDAAMLHDIGIFMTRTPEIGCFGSQPYIAHGYLGRELLEKEGLPRHALVCERHVGVGLSMQDIVNNGFPLPMRDMLPLTIEEKIICFADKFYSKHEDSLVEEKPVQEIRQMIAHFGGDHLRRFDEWMILFKEGELLQEKI